MLYNAGVMEVIVRERATRETDESVYERRMEGLLASEGVPFRLIDLFSGAGGLTLGFSSRMGHAFESVWANDYNLESVATYNANFGAYCTLGDISSILGGGDFDVPKADIVMGGPPCQGFSLLNRNRQGDPRKEMWRPFMDVVERSEASVFVIENVPQILGTPEHDAIMATARSMGFEPVGTDLFGRPWWDRPAFTIRTEFYKPEKGRYLHPEQN